MTAGVQCGTCGTCPGAVVPRRAGCAHGLCPNCWNRWKAAGFPEDGPPPPARPWERRLAGSLEDYAELRSWGLAPIQARWRLKVSRRTAERYEAALTAGGAQLAALRLARDEASLHRKAGREVPSAVRELEREFWDAMRRQVGEADPRPEAAEEAQRGEAANAA